jgi:pilus assembly protein Flp/PilA
MTMHRYLNRFVKDEAGAAGVEYGILVAAISVGIVAVSFVLGGYVSAAFDTVRDEFVAEGLQANPD